MSTLHEDLVYETLKEVVDPELGISVVDLGLIYEVKIEDGSKVDVKMTLTSPACPVGAVIQAQCHQAIKKLPWAKDVNVGLVWSPRWDPRTMASEDARMELGIL
ncbi:MAG: metal-sulfur cluster assembly factor [Candidatus Obscuribacter sp.]|jgi:metal-sulfur cluster biosynthetic enzyme|nr:metal-sulfur cluster assembly factor [Candidatus Obscuribacter sp.]MBK9203212.1 metal-sulfur cluster assembly factor [Candidatus Obscuribacter sp.]MBK9619322.1 metal-sulfur cluster assembly factor [Candidatus Obscuribacter sp.]MBK9769255.1 metal-sulfur cluster assembly factor [Candidatus Obscuribacter sp.]MBL0184808.1 metal-sulfur cluster assembly factor [Candidatus Obscuribacter sp.]